eukprot:scaffold1915_cov318-Pavlova_lutheri.AAC.1
MTGIEDRTDPPSRMEFLLQGGVWWRSPLRPNGIDRSLAKAQPQPQPRKEGGIRSFAETISSTFVHENVSTKEDTRTEGTQTARDGMDETMERHVHREHECTTHQDTHPKTQGRDDPMEWIPNTSIRTTLEA